jgi:tetratricopeptide (TPR) repeat protein/O-antigen ligase
MRPTRTKRLFWLLALAMYAVFLWRTPYSLKLFPLSVLDWLVPVVGLGVWVIASWRRQESWPHMALDIPLLAWMAAVLLSTAFSVDLRTSLHATWHMAVWLLLLWLMVSAVRHGWERGLWESVYLTGGVVCMLAAVELLAWYVGLPLLSTFQQGWLEIGGLLDPIPPVIYRIGFTLAHSTVLAAFLSLLVPPAICFVISSRVRDVRVGMLLWLVAAAVVLGFTSSRGGILALAVSLPLLVVGAIQSPQLRDRWSAWSRGTRHAILALILTLGLVAVTGAGYFVLSRMGERTSGDAVRQDLWRSALAMLQDHPVTGVGAGAFGYAVREYRNPFLARDQIATAHNLYLNAGAEMGIPGLLAGGLLLLAMSMVWWQRWKRSPPGSPSWWQVLGVGAALAGLAAQMMVETFTEPAVLLPATFFVAIIAGPGTGKQRSKARGQRWPWVMALVFLVGGSTGKAWDTRAYAHFRHSVTALQQGDADEAVAAAERAARWDPWLPLYSCHLAYLHGLDAARGQNTALLAALGQYGNCLDGMPVPGWLDRLNMAAVQWQAGQKNEARYSVQQATANTPLEWLPWLNRGLWAEEEGDQEEAIRSYGRVLALDPQLAGSPFWRETPRASWWSKIIAAGQESTGAGTAWRWQVLLAARLHDQAVGELESWLEAHPADATAMAWLGEALLALGRPSEAMVWLDQSLASAPARAESYLSRGEAETSLGLYEEAAHDLRTALFLNPDSRVHLGLARLARETGDEDLALAEYSQAQRVFSVPQTYPQVLYRRMGWSVPLPQVVWIGYSYDAEVALEWGDLLEARGDTDTAAKVYQAALNLDPFLNEVRQCLERLGD